MFVHCANLNIAKLMFGVLANYTAKLHVCARFELKSMLNVFTGLRLIITRRPV